MKIQKIDLLNYDLLYDILKKLKLKKYIYQINHILSIFNVTIDDNLSQDNYISLHISNLNCASTIILNSI